MYHVFYLYTRQTDISMIYIYLWVAKCKTICVDIYNGVEVWVQWLQNTLLKSRGTVHDWHNLYSVLCIVLCIHALARAHPEIV